MKSAITSIAAVIVAAIIGATIAMYPIQILWNWLAYNFNFVEITLGQAWLGALLIPWATIPFRVSGKANIE